MIENLKYEFEDIESVEQLEDFDDEYVYDIETDNHMFFANDILVHNSNYMDLTDILNQYYKIL